MTPARSRAGGGRATVVLACLSIGGCKVTSTSMAQPPPEVPRRFPATYQVKARTPVRVELLSCESLYPLVVEETLPDGRPMAVSPETSRVDIRLELELQSLSNTEMLVAFCAGGLAVVPIGSPRPYCERMGDSGWLLLRPGGRVWIYPAISTASTSEGVFTEALVPHAGRESLANWPQYRPNAIRFTLSSGRCRVLGGKD